jgi:hypothetical protein
MYAPVGHCNSHMLPPRWNDRTETLLRLRLQRLLAKLDFSLGESTYPGSGRKSLTGDVIITLGGMAVLAAETELCGFASICVRLAERLEPLDRQLTMPPRTLVALAEWLLEADRYLRRPQSRVRTASLVVRLNDPAWNSPLEDSERIALITETCLAGP